MRPSSHIYSNSHIVNRSYMTSIQNHNMSTLQHNADLKDRRSISSSNTLNLNNNEMRRTLPVFSNANVLDSNS